MKTRVTHDNKAICCECDELLPIWCCDGPDEDGYAEEVYCRECWEKEKDVWFRDYID